MTSLTPAGDQATDPDPAPQRPDQPLSPPLRKDETCRFLIAVSACGMLIGFFLPCVRFLAADLTGFDIQKNFSSYQIIWIMPLFAVIVLTLVVTNQKPRIIRRIAGLSPFAILGYSLSRLGSDLLGALEVGAWVALVCGFLLLVLPNDQAPGKAA